MAKSELTAAMIRAKDKYAPKSKKPRYSKQPLEDLLNGNDSPVKDLTMKDSTMKDSTMKDSHVKDLTVKELTVNDSNVNESD